MVTGTRGASATPPWGGGAVEAGGAVLSDGCVVGAALVVVGSGEGRASGSARVEAGPLVGSDATASPPVSSLRTCVSPMIATPAMRTMLTSITILLQVVRLSRSGVGRPGNRS